MPNKKRVILFSTLFLITISFLYAFSQFSNKKILQAALQQEINLNIPGNIVSAILTSDQKLSNDKFLPKGTKFFGKISKKENEFVIDFNSIQTTDGKKQNFYAISYLGAKEEIKKGGVSAKISKTVYKQTRTNVLGAIFNSSDDLSKGFTSTIPRGSIIKIETN